MKKEEVPPSTSIHQTGPEKVEELRQGVLSLADRVNNLSSALATVNKIQTRVSNAEARAKEAQSRTSQLEEDLIPRAEHEQRWKKEQAALIETRLSIRRQTYIIGTVFFLVSMLILGGVYALVIQDIHDRNVTRCQANNDYKQGDRNLWSEVLSLNPGKTPDDVQAKARFEAFLNKHDALAKC